MKITNQQQFKLIDGSGVSPRMVRVSDKLYVLDKNAVVRLGLDGRIDTSFDGDGLAYLPSEQLQGYHIVPTGSGLGVFSVTGNTYPNPTHQLVTFSSGGSTGFAATTSMLPSLQGDFANVVGYGKHGVLYLGGGTYVDGRHVAVISKVSAAGQEDAAFSSSASAAVDAAGFYGGGDIIEDGAGRVYVLASETVPADHATDTPAHYVSKLLRLLPGGALDRTFGADGIVAFGRDMGASALAMLADGSIVVGLSGAGGKLAKLSFDGKLDSTFGTNGYATLYPGSSDGVQVSALVVDGNEAFAVVSSYPSYKVTVVPVDAGGARMEQAVDVLKTSSNTDLTAYLDPLARQIVVAAPTLASGGLEFVTVSYAATERPPVGLAPPVGGGAGNDTFANTDLQDTFNGGAGIDHLRYGDVRAKYAIRLSNGKVVVEDLETGARDSLTDVERVHFSDVSIGFDTDGAGGQAYRIYRAAFGRTPDEAGLGYWISALDNGLSLAQLAESFIKSVEHERAFGSGGNHARQIEKYYTNVLGRIVDDEGLNYWVEVLDSGRASKAEVLAAISESAENHALVIGAIENGFAYVPYG